MLPARATLRPPPRTALRRVAVLLRLAPPTGAAGPAVGMPPAAVPLAAVPLAVLAAAGAVHQPPREAVVGLR